MDAIEFDGNNYASKRDYYRGASCELLKPAQSKVDTIYRRMMKMEIGNEKV